MAIMTFGKLRYIEGKWIMDELPPHVSIKVKSIFPHIPKTSVCPYKFSHTMEHCTDLLWFTQRYPLEISKEDSVRLNLMKQQADKYNFDLGRILQPDYIPSKRSFKKGKEERAYQAIARTLFLKNKRMVCGDDLGLGKTTVALGAFMDANTLPAVVVVQTHLPKQWEQRIQEFTNLRVHIVKTRKPYSLPAADIYIMKYTSMQGWVDIFETGFFKCAVFDEIQELRNCGSEKYYAAKVLSNNVEYVLGLTATLIYNYGNEAYNIFDLVKQGCLGNAEDFNREWTSDDRKISDPAALGSYLRSNYLFLRRTRADVNMELPPVNKIVHTVEADEDAVRKIEDLALSLSMKVIGGTFSEAGQASRELDILVRRNTGLSKAHEVANYAKLFLENNEPIILVGWHRDVYDIWLEALKEYNPVMFTGSESPNQKEEAKRKFISGETNLMIMSLRAGPGTDGLQARCQTMIIGELDWSPGVHNQLIGRIDRDGQKGNVMVVYVVCDQGSDPVMLDILGLKSSQAAYINDPTFTGGIQHSDESRIKQLANMYLKKKKGDINLFA